MVIDDIKLPSGKTKEMVSFLSGLKINQGKTVLVLEKIEVNIKRSSANIENLKVVDPSNLNAHLILGCQHLILTEAVLKLLSKDKL